jgi:hypothetical protein
MNEANKTPDLEWEFLIGKLTKVLGKKPNLDAILFLIGVQELGRGKKRFSKEEKQDLMHVGVCRLLSQSGYYVFEGRDEDGWPHFKLVKPLPKIDLQEQEELLRMHVKEYFAYL